ncbi:hypothetical protein ACA910_014130 [Epithemia clementina (nom. ined.)]
MGVVAHRPKEGPVGDGRDEVVQHAREAHSPSSSPVSTSSLPLQFCLIPDKSNLSSVTSSPSARSATLTIFSSPNRHGLIPCFLPQSQIHIVQLPVLNERADSSDLTLLGALVANLSNRSVEVSLVMYYWPEQNAEMALVGWQIKLWRCPCPP